MRIGFDMDGVLADLHATFTDTASRLFPELAETLAGTAVPANGSSPDADDEGKDAPDAAAGRAARLSRRQTDAVWRELLAVPSFWESLEETEPGIVLRLAQVADERRWEVIFLTSRPVAAGPTVQRQTQRWLERHGFPLPSVFVVDAPRGPIADALQLDVVVDDRPQTCLDIAIESKARPVLVWRGTTEDLPHVARHPEIGVVSSVGACLDLLIAAEGQSGKNGVLHRLRRLLGLSSAET